MGGLRSTPRRHLHQHPVGYLSVLGLGASETRDTHLVAPTRKVQLISADDDGEKQALVYESLISLVRRGSKKKQAGVTTRHIRAKGPGDLRRLLSSPTALTVFVGHSGPDRIGSEERGQAWVDAQNGTIGGFCTNGLILDTCGTTANGPLFQPESKDPMAVLRCEGSARNRDGGMIAYLLASITAGAAPALDSAAALHDVFDQIARDWTALSMKRSLVDLEPQDGRSWSVSLVPGR